MSPGTTRAADVLIRRMEKRDFDHVVAVIDRWWGGPSGERAHPVFFYELGEHALIAEEQGRMVGFLLGFVTPQPTASKDAEAAPYGFVHLVGIHPDHRRRGVGQLLYAEFGSRCRAIGVSRLKATTYVGNEGSVHYHLALGFTVEEKPDYAGPDRPRIVFTKAL